MPLFRKPILACTVVAVLLAGFGAMYRIGAPASAGTTIRLQFPSFVGVARADGSLESTSEIGALLDSEAGISAYYRAPDAITLSQVRGQFRTIETETSDYIIGSVLVPNYVELFDVHAYVHRSGWILAYYLRNDPVSKILDVKASTISTTKLKTVVASLAGVAGAPFTDVTYYDFRYPNATNLLLVAEDSNNGDVFTIRLPSGYGYYERSWAVLGWRSTDHFAVDGQIHPNAIYCGDYTCFGTVTAAQLLPDINHTIRAAEYGVLAVVYRVP